MFSVYHRLKIKRKKEEHKKAIIILSILSIPEVKEEFRIKHKIPRTLQIAIIMDLIPKDKTGKMDKIYEHIKNKL